MFADRATIYVRSGKGGDGHVSFRREKYVPNGGPDGGDGGDGGSVILKVDDGVNTLSDYRHVRKYKAGDGEEGRKKNCRGKNGNDIVLKLPRGTVVKEAESDQVIVDMSGDTEEFLLLKGGKGGNGNQHYATSTMQAPKYAQPGGEATELTLKLELKVIADVGLVGFPNVGKSTFLTKISNARPEIANYHFTTISPHLGVVDLKDAQGFIVADIPGLIEGASDGVGLGHEFLRHIERTKVIIHIVDAAGTEGRDPVEDIRAINKELALYNEELPKRPQIIAANKLDMIYEGMEPTKDEVIARLKSEFEPMGYEVYPMSALTGEGVKEILFKVRQMLDKLDDKPVVFKQEYDPFVRKSDLSEPFTVEYDSEEDEYVVEGPRIEKMLGYTNLESEKGFLFFQKFIKENGIAEKLKDLGCEEGDTVRMYGLKFEYYT